MIKRPDAESALLGVTAEFLFILLPLLVIVIVTAARGVPIGRIIAGPEWSVAAAILGGLALVRLVTGVSSLKRPSSERIALAVAVVFVLALVPALMILTIVVVAVEPAGWLVSAQLLQFLVCSAVFLIFGTTGRLWVKLSTEEEYLTATESELAEHKRRELENAVIGILESSDIRSHLGRRGPQND